MAKVSLKSDESDLCVEFGEGEHDLGRGEALGIAEKTCSRKQSVVNR